MRLLLIKLDGKDIGYSLIPEDNNEKVMLKRVQNLHFLESNKQQRMKYDGVMLDENNTISSLSLLQYQYARLPHRDSVKHKIMQIIKVKIKEIFTGTSKNINKRNSNKLIASIERPFEVFNEIPNGLFAEYSDSKEYIELDDIYYYLTFGTGHYNLPEDLQKESVEELIIEYNKRFSSLFGKVMQEVGKRLENGKFSMRKSQQS